MSSRKRADHANATSTPPPVPYVVEPSGVFDGNDGRWSTFYINLGDKDASGHGQNFRVLISTSSPVTLVPAQSEWCNSDCAKDRGVQVFNGEQPLGYESDSSPTWVDAGVYTIPQPDWWNRGELNGTLGIENVGLGESSTESYILQEQLVLKYTFEDYYLGSFGLAAGSVAAGNSERPPFLYNLAKGAAHSIPSASYGHTAGASYRNNGKGITGNLVLGGYDSTRVKIEQGAIIDMPTKFKNNTLVVGVQSILYKPDPDIEANTFSFTEDSKGFLATIDSTLPYLWLPEEVCDKFAERFNLEYDEGNEFYTVDASAHRKNQRLNATVSFRIGKGPEASDPFTSIVFPYEAFYYTIDKPVVENATQYFPIKKSPNGIYVLGRTFLQESYIIVDYERANFTVAPVRYSGDTEDRQLVPIYNETYSPPGIAPTPLPALGGGGGLSPGAVAGIVVGVVVVFLLASLGLFFWWKKRRQARQQPYAGKAEEIDTMGAGTEVKHRRISELDSEPPNSPKQSINGLYGRDQKDGMPFPPISEMESPPAELYSPPPLSSTHSDGNGSTDYFTGKVRRRGATRESSGNNTPSIPGVAAPAPLAELPGDEGKYQASGLHLEPISSTRGRPVPNRGPSDTSPHSKIDEIMKRPENSPVRRPEAEKENEKGEVEPEASLERRPSHTRDLSDTTVQSDTTAVSQPTPEELVQWAMGGKEGPRRPLSE